MKKRNHLKIGIMAITLTLALAIPAFAAWVKLGPDVRITNDANRSYGPSMAWAGMEYGVSWVDDRDGNWEIYFARVDSAGNKIGADVRITNAINWSLNPSLVWTGTEYGLSWQDSRDAWEEIYFARVDSAGNKIGADVRITNAAGSSKWLSLVWTGTEYGVSWVDDRDGASNQEIYFARIDSAGNKIGADVRITNDVNWSLNPSLVWTGTEYGVSWYDDRDGNYEIYFVRIDSAGNKIGADVRITNDANLSKEPSLVWTGTEYGVSWYDDRDGAFNYEIYFTRVDSAGNKIGADVRITNDVNISDYPSLVWAGTEYGVSWRDNRDGNWEIYFARFDSAGNKIGADVRITNAVNNSYYPSLVWTGTEYGVSWQDWRDGNWEIYFARIGSGEPIIPTLSEYMMILMGVMLLAVMIYFQRSRRGGLVRYDASK